ARPVSVRPHFSGHNVTKPDPIAQKLTQYRQDWLNLIQWDQSQHSAPVLKKVRLDRLMTTAQTFLQRQHRTHADGGVVPFMVGLAGGSASGKSTVLKHWQKALGETAPQTVGWTPEQGAIHEQIRMDDYYRDFSQHRQQIGDEAFF